MTCNTAQKHTPIDKASPRHAGEVPPPAARERRAHTAAHSRCSQAGAAQKRQRQCLPRSGARELGGHGMPITSRPEPGGPGARQARADEICSHTPQRPRPANFGSKLLQSWHDTFIKTQSPCGEPPKRPHCAIDLNPNPGNSPDTPPGPSRQVAGRGPALTGNRSTRKGVEYWVSRRRIEGC